MSKFKVSVIVPVYNAESYIETALSSLLTQSLDDIEIIIINDGSTDNSLSLIEKTLDRNVNKKKHITLISRENKGVAATRNQGLKKAQGEYIIHFDSDDWASKNWLKYLYEKAIEEKSDIVICDYNEVHNKSRKHIPQKIYASKEENVNALLTGEINSANWNKLVKRSIINDNNIQYIDNLNMGEDFLITLMILLQSKKFSHVASPLYFYNKINQASLTYNYSMKSLYDVLKVTEIAEQLLVQENYRSKKNEGLDYFKLGVKNIFIAHANGNADIIKKGLSLYPEIGYLINTKAYPKFLKLIFNIDKYKLNFLYKSIYSVYRFYKKIK
ncbi:glycosyltransferase family 2 protein [Providencia manganoxydans]|uniref:glycosyltransferase family 2 protein n=1 Tax=Providencia TaxID=586 RepID=UPI0015DB8CC7|nr:glycosyltransferase [Providencia stuartii]